MPAFTADQLEARVRAAADCHDKYVTTSMIYGWLDRERRKLEMMAVRGGFVLHRVQTDVTPTGLDQYPLLPSPPIMAVLGVYEVDTSGNGTRLRRLARGNPVDVPRDYFAAKARSYNVYLDGNDVLQIELRPNVVNGGPYRVYYTPEPAALTTGSDTVFYPAGWEELLVLGAAVSALAREESSNPVLERQYREAEARITGEIAAREASEGGAAVRNTDYLYAPDDWTMHPVFFRDEVLVL